MGVEKEKKKKKKGNLMLCIKELIVYKQSKYPKRGVRNKVKKIGRKPLFPLGNDNS